MLKNLNEFTLGLKEKEKEVFSQRLFSEVPKTLQELADKYGLTRERVRQIESRVVTKMQKFFKEKGMDVAVKN